MPPNEKTDMNLPPPTGFLTTEFFYVPVSCIKFLPPPKVKGKEDIDPRSMWPATWLL